uniref:Uncharacterized protein n=1 Tax=Leptobrachium leishanense TaxID=445787 RepID=A0A8C5QNR1_9ANUR
MTDISWLARNLSAFSSFQKVSLSLSQTTEKEWKKAVKTSSQVIFYHSRHSKRSVQDLHRFLEQCAYINSEKRVTEETQKKSSSECLDIGIFSRSADRGKLLQTSLSQTNRGGLLKEVRHINISRSTKEEIRKEISRCLYAILHVTRKNIGDMDYLSLFEMMKRTALVLIDDLEDTPVGKMPPAKNNIPVAEMNIRPGRLAAMKNRGPKQRPPHRFGIFSRSAEMDYDWLQSLLLAEHFRDQVSDVQSFYISNNGLLQFEEDVSRCSVGILYHTKNRGGINVTDVMSSLYDAELELLSNVLGRDNVLVVIDDLEDSSSSEKCKILEEQPSIGKFAGDLLLVAEVEKKDEFRLLGKLNKIELFNPACKMLTETGYYNL